MGFGVQFGPDITERFMQENKLGKTKIFNFAKIFNIFNVELLVRSKEIKTEGYELQ